jgi:hypothetical protein
MHSCQQKLEAVSGKLSAAAGVKSIKPMVEGVLASIA